MPLTVNKRANERSTYGLTITFLDESGEALTPSSITWTLTDSAGVLINGRDSVVVSPASSILIVLSGADLPIDPGLSTQRVITIEAVYSSSIGSDLPFKDQVTFGMNDLVAIPDPITP